MFELSTLLLPLGIWATLYLAARLGGGTDLDYRAYEQRAAYTLRARDEQITRRSCFCRRTLCR